MVGSECLCDHHPRSKTHGGPCCGVAGGLCVACRTSPVAPHTLTDYDKQ
jgi:hypothetical protein